VHVFFAPDPHLNALPGAEGFHAARALRLRPGCEIAVTNGLGEWYRAEITGLAPNVTFRILETRRHPPPRHHIHLAVAPTKNHDRMEWMVEKVTEIGIQEISFVLTEKTERKKIQSDRLQKVAVAAMKQSQQAWLPKINDLRPWQEAVRMATAADIRCIAHAAEHGAGPHLVHVAAPERAYLVLIGPEGDFTASELAESQALGFQPVSLGPHRLRTETAALAACAALNLINQR
jgi:16S rRNA (uracil1498-N3)-methyltransferase